MTRFEELINKANNCIKTALGLPNGFMRDVWAQKGRELKEMAYNLSIEDGTAEVENERNLRK